MKISTKEISSIEEVANSFKIKYNQVEEIRAVMLDEIRRLETRIEALRAHMPEPPNWTTKFVEPIARLAANELNVEDFKVIEINDLQKSVKVSFFNSDEKELYKITLIPEDLEEGLIHYKTGEMVNKNYKEGTIGALNDMRDKTAPLPLNNIKEVANLIREL